MPGGATVYLPYTLPGETVITGPLTRRGQGWTADATVLTASPKRATPPCPHFGACGGCTLQHWADAPYAAWKAAQLAAALARAGFDAAAIAPLARTPPANRRRVDLGLERAGGTVRVGLHRHRGRELVDLHTCLVLDPALVALIAALRHHLPAIGGLRRTGSAVANLLDTGIDLLLRTDGLLSAADRSRFAALAQEAGLCRIAWAQGGGAAEVASQAEPARITLAGATVEPPPGAFLQASRHGEAAITAAVLAGLPERAGRNRVVELYAGCGTLTFAMAERARVVAYEGDADAAAALRRAVAGRPVEVHQRDLTRQPLSIKELTGAMAVVLDPPFAGAAAQMAAIAGSGAASVVYVSCNPAALARDARALRAAGYGLHLATPVDQFLWSAAVESVCVFTKPGRHAH